MFHYALYTVHSSKLVDDHTEVPHSCGAAHQRHHLDIT